MLTANRDYFCTHNCYIIILRQSCQIILPRTYITAVNDGVLRALIDKTEYSTDALMYIIQTIAPLFNLHKVIVYGSTFDDQIEAIYQVQQDLKHHQDPYFHDLTVEYHSYEFDEKHEELILLSYEALIDNLNLDD